jgi:two-component system, OmpR family, response regulator PhoP
MRDENVIQQISVCVVEDDVDIREEVLQTLREHNYIARGYSCARELYLGLIEETCDVVILDIGLPDEDGFTILQNLRRKLSVGIVMFTARGQTNDRVRALLEGADAYLVKPVDMDELMATIMSLWRRLQIEEEPAQENELLWAISGDGWIVTSPLGVEISLSSLEKTFVMTLLQKKGAVANRDTLNSALGYPVDDVLSNRLDMMVSRLRRKISSATDEKFPLHSVRGIGFSLHLRANQK